MNTTVLIYWPTGGNVENAARMIAKAFDNISVMPLSEVTEETLNAYQSFIVGGSTAGSETWEGTKNKSPWNSFFKLIESKDLSSKKVALFGLGDQVLWPANFVDGLQVIYSAFGETGATIVGKWPVDGYDFTESKAVVDGYFVGLALDEDQQAELSEERIAAWVKQLKAEF